MELLLDTLRLITGKPLNAKQKANAASFLEGINLYGTKMGLDQPHRMAQYLAQLLHESGAFIYDREIASGAAYEGRKDLDNTKKGDGKKFKGRGPIQITGRKNYRQFTQWCRKNIDAAAPDFEKNPDAVNTDPWEGLVPIWYWETRDLNRYADRGDIENITKKINGGLNGFEDRVRWYTRTALVLLGYSATDIKAFQKFAKLEPVDGVAGPITRAALHTALVKETNPADRSSDIKAAPVVQEKKVIPQAAVKAVESKSRMYGFMSSAGNSTAFGVFQWINGQDWDRILLYAGIGLLVGLVFYFFNKQIIAKFKEIRDELDS